jgi:hypothetical protein
MSGVSVGILDKLAATNLGKSSGRTLEIRVIRSCICFSFLLGPVLATLRIVGVTRLPHKSKARSINLKKIKLIKKMSNLKPVYIKQNDIHPMATRQENQVQAYEVYMPIARLYSEEAVEMVQQIKSLWRVYVKSVETRANLLKSGVSIKGKIVNVHDENPLLIKNNPDFTQLKKVIINDLPLEVSNEDVESLIKSFPGAKLARKVQYRKVRSPEGSWTACLSGDRFCYLQMPVYSPLDKIASVGNIKCRIYHRSQKSYEK